jgi:hypothetical protein
MHYAKCLRNIVQSTQLFNTWHHSWHFYTIGICKALAWMARAIEVHPPYKVSIKTAFSLSLTLLAIFIS